MQSNWNSRKCSMRDMWPVLGLELHYLCFYWTSFCVLVSSCPGVAGVTLCCCFKILTLTIFFKFYDRKGSLQDAMVFISSVCSVCLPPPPSKQLSTPSYVLPSPPSPLRENNQWHMKHAVSPSSIQVIAKPRLWFLFITSKCGRDISITTPDVQISHVVSALTVLSLPRPTIYLRRGALAAGGESWLIVSSCNITGPSLRGQRLCTRIHNPPWNGIAAASADRYWITRLLVWSNFYAVFMKD